MHHNAWLDRVGTWPERRLPPAAATPTTARMIAELAERLVAKGTVVRYAQRAGRCGRLATICPPERGMWLGVDPMVMHDLGPLAVGDG